MDTLTEASVQVKANPMESFDPGIPTRAVVRMGGSHDSDRGSDDDEEGVIHEPRKMAPVHEHGYTMRSEDLDTGERGSQTTPTPPLETDIMDSAQDTNLEKASNMVLNENNNMHNNSRDTGDSSSSHAANVSRIRHLLTLEYGGNERGGGSESEEGDGRRGSMESEGRRGTMDGEGRRGFMEGEGDHDRVLHERRPIDGYMGLRDKVTRYVYTQKLHTYT
jgi:hypothetical protein